MGTTVTYGHQTRYRAMQNEMETDLWRKEITESTAAEVTLKKH